MLYVGLFCATFATLLLEILDARLLSVLTWYHLSFLAVSLAMLGMAAGAVHVFLAGPSLDGDKARMRLPQIALAAAVSIAICHVITLSIPIPSLNTFAIAEVLSVFAATIILAVPFYLSGLTVTIALTRMPRPIGRLYAWDLAGASIGCLAVVPLLDSGLFNASSLVLLAAAVGSVAAFCFARVAGRTGWVALAVAGCLFTGAWINGARVDGIEVLYPKNRKLWAATATVSESGWNSHSYVIVQKPVEEPAFMWGAGAASQPLRKPVAWIAIDGEAGTPITEWGGNPSEIDWVQHDVTALPYHLRRGKVSVIGVGGGRDILAAIWGGNSSIIGIEVNGVILNTLQGSHRSFAGIVDRPGVQLVHDDGRAYLTRTNERFDVIQMSLIDTWAATGAGAFTLSENGLYTREAWSMFLSRLTPTGVFSVSRWFDSRNVSETNRLLALAVAALLDAGVRKPVNHIVLLSTGGTATLVISPSPFTEEDRLAVERLTAIEGFTVRVSPWTGGSTERLDRIARSGSAAELRIATADSRFDYSPPTDSRPFFFNMLKPSSFHAIYSLPRGGVLWGNIRATATLVLLFAIATVLTVAIIIWPLLAAGAPPMPQGSFAMSMLFFAAIGLAFMLVQIAVLQRFSIFLGHPTYTFSVTLFGMILFAGIGSYLSDLFVKSVRRVLLLPIVTAAAICALALVIQRTPDAAMRLDLPMRVVVVIALLAPVSTLLGFFFPTGLRLVAQLSPPATAWMWGINGACGVLGSIIAVGISMWLDIQANLYCAAALYALTLVPLRALNGVTNAVESPKFDPAFAPD